MYKKQGRRAAAHTDIQQVERWEGGLDKEKNKYQHHHLECRNFGYQQVNDEVILERKYRVSCQTETHDLDEFLFFVPAHYIKKAVELFDVGDAVEQIHYPNDVKKDDEEKCHSAYRPNTYRGI